MASVAGIKGFDPFNPAPVRVGRNKRSALRRMGADGTGIGHGRVSPRISLRYIRATCSGVYDPGALFSHKSAQVSAIQFVGRNNRRALRRMH